MFNADQSRSERARAAHHVTAKPDKKNLLTTKEVATLTGFSTSYFEKGRIYGYGPKFLRVQSTGKTGKVLYRLSAVEAWLAAQECDPEALCNV